MDAETDVGPVIDTENRDRIVEWIDEARRAGAEALTGGTVEDGLIQPTVLEGIDPQMKVSCEEVFGPVVGLAGYDTIDEAIDLANSSPFGLQAGIFTARPDAALRGRAASTSAGCRSTRRPPSAPTRCRTAA